MLCETGAVRPPPGAATSQARDETVPLREATERATVDMGADCAGCHRFVNQYGYAFMHFDYLGHLVESDGVAQIDSSGELPAELHGEAVRFGNQRELIQALVTQSDVARCLTRQMFRYALRPSVNIDGPGLRGTELEDLELIHDTFWSSEGDLRVLIRSIVESSAFLLGVEN